MSYTDPNHEESSSTSPALLWTAIVLIGVVFFFVTHDFQTARYPEFAPWSASEGTLEAGSNWVKGAALSLIGLLGLYCLCRREGRRLQIEGLLPALMIFYLAWAAASLAWSIQPGMSARRLAVLMFCVLGALGFARQFQARDIAFMTVVILGAYLAVGIAAETALGTFRPWASGYRFAGTVHPNTQGGHLTVLCLASLCLARSSGSSSARRYWALFAVGLAFLLLTKSRTSCGALALALAVLWFAGAAPRARLLAVVTAGFVVSTAMLLGGMVGADIDDNLVQFVMLGRAEGSEQLTGRLPIWLELGNYIQARPWQGYGYEAFWNIKHIEAVSETVQWPLREAHNAYVDCTLSVGLIGAGAFLLGVLAAMRRAAARYRDTADPGFAFTLAGLAFGLCSACLESGMASTNVMTLLIGSGVTLLAFGQVETAETCEYEALGFGFR